MGNGKWETKTVWPQGITAELLTRAEALRDTQDHAQRQCTGFSGEMSKQVMISVLPRRLFISEPEDGDVGADVRAGYDLEPITSTLHIWGEMCSFTFPHMFTIILSLCPI